MPAPRKREDNPDKAKLVTIVQFPLLPEELPDLQALVVNQSECLNALDEAVREGWSFTIERNTARKNYGCLAKMQNPESEDAGVGFYSNAATPWKALVTGVYKVFLPRSGSMSDAASKRGGNSEYS